MAGSTTMTTWEARVRGPGALGADRERLLLTRRKGWQGPTFAEGLRILSLDWDLLRLQSGHAAAEVGGEDGAAWQGPKRRAAGSRSFQASTSL